MEDETRFGILARAERVPECERGQYIITETVKAVRARDAELSDQAIRAEFEAWWRRECHTPCILLPLWLNTWTRHILTRGGLAD